MSETAPRFNLIDEPWILCRLVDGTTAELSIREIFARAPAVRRVAGELATQDYAVLRILLAIFWRAHVDDDLVAGPRPDARRWWLELLRRAPDGPDPCVDDYLAEVHDRFWLLHPEAPFLQVADLRTGKGEHFGAARILVDSESEYFAQRVASGAESLSPAEAARWLVHAHAFEYSGIKSGAVGDPRVKGGKGYPIGTGWAGSTGGVVLHGSTVGQTLVLNTPADLLVGDRAERDFPAWERPPAAAAPRPTEHPDGPCDVLTWQSRRIRLFAGGDGPADRITGVLVANGDRIEAKNQFADPMTAYRYSRNQSSKAQTVHMPQTHDPVRTLWRGVGPLLQREGATEAGRAGSGDTAPKPPRTVRSLARFTADEALPTGTSVDVELVGAVYGTQSAVVTDVVHDRLTVELGLLTAQGEELTRLVVDAAETTTAATSALGSFAGMLLQAAGGDYAYQGGTAEAVLHGLDTRFRAWVRGLSLGVSPEQVREQWHRTVRWVIRERAGEMITGAGQRALIGRTVVDRNGKEQLASAATAEQWLLRRLYELMPPPDDPGRPGPDSGPPLPADTVKTPEHEETVLP
ncbi:MAG: type I-E CRISPR-associated protein Cse1/CasA [Actinomycetota bacterium]